MQFPSKSQHNSSRPQKNHTQLHMENQKPRIAKIILHNKETYKGHTIHYFKLYYKPIVIKTTLYLYKNRHIDQWNWIEDPDINAHLNFEHLIFDKETKIVQWQKESIFNEWCWHNWMLTYRMQRDLSISIPMHKSQAQIDERIQHKSSHSENDRRQNGK